MEGEKITLDCLPIGYSAQIVSLKKDGNLRQRLLDLGFVEGTHVIALFKSPSGDPIAYSVRGTVIAIRREDTRCITVRVNE